MIRQPQVSIIIPTKNEEKNIAACLKSINKQNYPFKLEKIVVDNYSTDKTVKIAKLFTKKLIIAGSERSEQRNTGANSAKGKWLLFLDADMTLTKEAVSECLEIVSANPKSIIAINEEAVGKNFWAKALALEKRCYQREVGFIHSARFYPKKTFIKLGGYDKNLVAGEDWDLTRRFKKLGFKLAMTKKSYVIHHEPDISLYKMLKKEVYYLKNIKKYARKNQKVFKYQKNPLYRISIYLNSWQILLPHPLLSIGFIFYKFLVFILWKTIRL